jgi:hypothetical protein
MSVSKVHMAPTSGQVVALIAGGKASFGYHICDKLAKGHANFIMVMGCRHTSKGVAAVAGMSTSMKVSPVQVNVTHNETIDDFTKPRLEIKSAELSSYHLVPQTKSEDDRSTDRPSGVEDRIQHRASCVTALRSLSGVNWVHQIIISGMLCKVGSQS